jgi:hypothetical protein
VLIAVALLLFLCVIGFCTGESAKGLVTLILLATSLWAAIDSSRIRLREYRTQLSAHPILLFIGMWLFWIIVFPWYVVVRSRIRAGRIEKRHHVKRFVPVLLLIPAVLVLVALVSAALFIGAGGNVHGIWTATNTQSAAANAPGSTQTTEVRSDLRLQTYAGRLPDRTFWDKVGYIFIGNLIGQGHVGAMALDAFLNNLDTYIFAPCQYDAQTNMMTVTWRGKSKPEEGDIAGSLSEINAISFDVNNPDRGIVATFSEGSSDGARMTFYTHDRISPSDAAQIADGDLSAFPEALRDWAGAVIKQSDKRVKVEVE